LQIALLGKFNNYKALKFNLLIIYRMALDVKLSPIMKLINVEWLWWKT